MRELLIHDGSNYRKPVLQVTAYAGPCSQQLPWCCWSQSARSSTSSLWKPRRGLSVRALNQSWHSSSGHLDFQLAIASADAHRGLGERSSSETDVLGIAKCFIVMALFFYWKVSAVFMTLFSTEFVDALAPFKASPIDRGNAVSGRNGRKVKCLEYIQGRVRMFHFTKTWN